MDIFNLFTLVGGLALFLYGMMVMGDALVMLSGGKLESILEKLTSKKSLAILMGVLVTAIIQSSSATTVMVVGFVNSSIMKLSQAVGIIMGANIGTTVTSWILSLAGISSSNIFLKMLKPSSFSPVLAVIGIILLMISKDGTKKHTIGSIFLGFAVLMFGMETMSDSVSPLRSNEAFTGMLTAFSNPLLGMTAGAVLTAIIQSSSASVGILQAMCISGLVSYGTAIPVILGQNIGTCVTALISSVGASKNAKRAAFVHLYFNLIGTLVFMAVFYSLNHFLHFSFLSETASAFGVAIAHSLFNVSCVVFFYPFSNQLVKLAELTVRDKKADSREKDDYPELKALDERFLETPSFALNLTKTAVDKMAKLAGKSIDMAISLNDSYSPDTVKKIISIEQQIDRFEDCVGSYLVKIAGRDLNKEDSHLLSVLLHAISDYERISDHAINIAESFEKLDRENIVFTGEGKNELSSLCVAVSDILKNTSKAFINEDIGEAESVEPLEEVIDEIVMEMKQRHILRLRKGDCSMEAGLILEDIITNYERVSDHCSNIAVSMIEIQTDEYDVHKYVNKKVNDDYDFRKLYEHYRQIYVLP